MADGQPSYSYKASYATWAADVVGAIPLNEEWFDRLNAFGGGCMVRAGSALATIPGDVDLSQPELQPVQFTEVTWESHPGLFVRERASTSDKFDRITLPWVGSWFVAFSLGFVGNATGRRVAQVGFALNDTWGIFDPISDAHPGSTANNSCHLNAAGFYRLSTASSAVELVLLPYQDSGVNLALTGTTAGDERPVLACAWLGDSGTLANQ